MTCGWVLNFSSLMFDWSILILFYCCMSTLYEWFPTFPQNYHAEVLGCINSYNKLNMIWWLCFNNHDNICKFVQRMTSQLLPSLNIAFLSFFKFFNLFLSYHAGQGGGFKYWNSKHLYSGKLKMLKVKIIKEKYN